MLGAASLALAGVVNAAVISPGTPATSVPASLFDPFSTLSSPLAAGQFLLPVEITGASGLQDWSFDLTFDAAVVTPLDVGGLYRSVYQAEFNGTDPTLSNITSSGFPGAGVLAQIAGFSSGVSGDGVPAYVLFEYLTGQQGNPPGLGIDNPVIQQVPEPGTLALMAVLGVLTVRHLTRRRLQPTIC